MTRLTLRKHFRSIPEPGAVKHDAGDSHISFIVSFLFFLLDLCGALRLLSRTEVTALY